MIIRIAFRYFISRKSHGVVNVISGISVAGVAVATAAIIVVLSVFNGFTNLTKSRFSIIDPDLMIVPVEGKVFKEAEDLSEKIRGVPGVNGVAPTLTDLGLILVNDDRQVGVVFKGVDSNYADIVNIDDITDWEASNHIFDNIAPKAAITTGVASQLDFRPGHLIELFTVRRVGRINPSNPESGFFSAELDVDRIISIDQIEFDADRMIIPIDVARELLQYYDNEASAIEVRLAKGADFNNVRRSIASMLGPGYKLLSREEQHTESYRMISIEKWVTFSMMIFILVIAAFNIISTLSLMVIEKRDNMSTLRFLGATRGMVRSIFATMGAIITIIGGFIGIILGIALSLAQEWGGFIKLNGDKSNLTITEYPVHVEVIDILAVAAIVAVVSVIIALATRLFTRKIA